MKTNFFRNLFKNPVQKLLAFSFALIIWALAPTARKEILTEAQFFVPVSYVNLPKDIEITSPPLQSVSVAVEFSQKDIKDIHPSNFQVIIDLEKAESGEKEYTILPRNIKSPSSVNVVKVSPEKIKLAFEKSIERTLPVHPVFIGELAKGYVIKKVILDPQSLKIRGPVSVLRKMEQLETRAINIDQVDSDLDMVVHVLFPDKVSLANPNDNEIYTARILIGSEPIVKRYDNIPIGVLNQIYVTRINPKVFNIVLRGPRSLMDTFNPKDIQAFIDLQSYTPGNHKINAPTVRLRPEIQVQKMWPPIDIWVLHQKVDE